MFSGKISVLCEVQKLVIVSVRGDTNRGGEICIGLGKTNNRYEKSIDYKKN